MFVFPLVNKIEGKSFHFYSMQAGKICFVPLYGKSPSHFPSEPSKIPRGATNLLIENIVSRRASRKKTMRQKLDPV